MRFSAILLLILVLTATDAAAQGAASAPPAPGFGILDNSFLLEEAFNQDAGIFQNISTFRWQRGSWVGSFTQEWPAPNQMHQLSFTLPFGREDGPASIGDILINYRYQALTEGEGRPAFSPRISVILPSASDASGLGSDGVGWQLNLPFSKGTGHWYFHVNAGLTYLPLGEGPEDLVIPMVAGSMIWEASPTLNLMFETVIESSDGRELVTLSPGFRKAWNLGDQQIVAGIAAPLTRSEQQNVGSIFFYFSYELPFK